MRRLWRHLPDVFVILVMTTVMVGCYGGAATPETSESQEVPAGKCVVSDAVFEAGTIGEQNSRALARSDALNRVSCRCGTPEIVDEECERFGEANWSCVITYRCTK